MTTQTIYSYDQSTPEQWKEFIQRLNNYEALVIDESMFYYWLEILPPVYMGEKQIINIDGVTYPKQCSFGFAEGREHIVDFWGEGNKDEQGNKVYFCKRSTRMNKWA